MLCLPESEKYDAEQGVMNYPRKGKKTLVKEASALVCILHSTDKDGEKFYSCLQRPETGLLASLYEFPNADSEHKEDAITKKTVAKMLQDNYGIEAAAKSIQKHGEYTHKFSHLKQTYFVWSAELDDVSALSSITVSKDRHQQVVAKSADEILNSAPVSTAMKKVFAVYQKKSTTGVKRKGSDKESDRDCKRQKSIMAFFGKK